MGTDRFPHGRAVASFGLTSRGLNPGWGQEAPGPCTRVFSSRAAGLRPESDLPTGTFPAGGHGSHEQALSTSSLVYASQQGWAGPFTGGWGVSCLGKQPPKRGLVFLLSP